MVGSVQVRTEVRDEAGSILSVVDPTLKMAQRPHPERAHSTTRRCFVSRRSQHAGACHHVSLIIANSALGTRCQYEGAPRFQRPANKALWAGVRNTHVLHTHQFECTHHMSSVPQQHSSVKSVFPMKSLKAQIESSLVSENGAHHLV